jgi:hypothetical protein
VTFISFEAISFSVCERKTGKVLAASTEENIQPFKDKMETFLSSGKLII